MFIDSKVADSKAFQLKKDKLLWVNNYPCKFSKYFVVIIAILLISCTKTRKIGFVFGIFALYFLLLKKEFESNFSYQDIIRLIEDKDFKKMSLSIKNILIFSVKLSYDSFVKAPIDAFKFSKSTLMRIMSILGIMISPIQFSFGLLYSAIELTFLYIIAKRKKLVILFSEEVYYKLTRTIVLSRKDIDNEELFRFTWCGIPGILIVPQEYNFLVNGEVAL
jgi:hypothetical protein